MPRHDVHPARLVLAVSMVTILGLVAGLASAPPAVANPSMSQITSAKVAVKKAKKAKKRAAKKFRAVRARTQEAKTAYDALSGRLEVTEANNSQLAADHTAAVAQHRAAQARLTQAQQELQAARRTLDTATANPGTPATRLQRLTAAVTTAQKSVQAARRALQTAAETAADTQAALNADSESFAAQEQRTAAAKATFEKRKGNLEKAKKVLKKRRAILKKRQKKLKRVMRGVNPRHGGLLRPGTGGVTSGFGWRWGRMHEGVDLAAGNWKVRAAAKGKVVSVGWVSGYGLQVRISHGKVKGRSFVTSYAHLSREYVRKGQRVPVGKVIGRVGSTGFTTGPHLHFEVRRGGRAVNPMPWIT